MTDPTGNSGGRVACGVVVAGAQTAAAPTRAGGLPALLSARPLGLAGAALAGRGALLRRRERHQPFSVSRIEPGGLL